MRIFEEGLGPAGAGKERKYKVAAVRKFTGVFGMQMHIDDRLGIGL